MKKTHVLLIGILINLKLYADVIKYNSTSGSALTGYGAGRDMSKWVNVTTGATVSMADFQVAGNDIDLNGKIVNFAGMTIGNVNILNNLSSSTAQVRNIPTGSAISLTINSQNPPNFSASSGKPLDWTYLGDNGLIIYNYSSGTQNLIPSTKQFNIQLSNGNKSVDRLFLGGKLTIDAGYTLTCSDGIWLFKTNTGEFSMNSGSKIIYSGTMDDRTSTAPYYLYSWDERTTKTYAGTHEFNLAQW